MSETTKFAPERVMTLRGILPVSGWRSYPPGQHPALCPIVGDLTALEVCTAAGSRWYGVKRAWIGSDLRMRVQGFNPRFEGMMAWEDADTDDLPGLGQAAHAIDGAGTCGACGGSFIPPAETCPHCGFDTDC